MRYIVQDQVLPTKHPMHPDRTVYFVMDLNTRRLGFSYYLTYDRAKQIVDRKNKL